MGGQSWKSVLLTVTLPSVHLYKKTSISRTAFFISGRLLVLEKKWLRLAERIFRIQSMMKSLLGRDSNIPRFKLQVCNVPLFRHSCFYPHACCQVQRKKNKHICYILRDNHAFGHVYPGPSLGGVVLFCFKAKVLILSLWRCKSAFVRPSDCWCNCHLCRYAWLCSCLIII